MTGFWSIVKMNSGAGEAISQANGGANIYVEGRTIKPETPTRNRGSADDTVGVFALVTDSDKDKDKEALDPLLEPSLVIETSPGNLHQWYFLEQAVGPEEGKELGKGLNDGARADSATGVITQPFRVAMVVYFDL